MLRIATRRSPLALWQAEHVSARLKALHPGLEISLVPMTTKGDQWLQTSLSKVGGKGLFVKELETALLDGRADIAVHSMKDVPAECPPGLGITTILEREDPRDALIGAPSIDALPQGGRVGTASQRRQLQLRRQRPDLEIGLLRGNVNTRLRKLDEGEFDAIVLASSGLQRLQLDERIDAILEPELMLPAVGQGALGIETRLDDPGTAELLAPLHDAHTATCVIAERSMSACLGGSCQLPIAGYATLGGDEVHLRALFGAPDASRIVEDAIRGPASDPEALGRTLGERLLAAGGDEILKALHDSGD